MTQAGRLQHCLYGLPALALMVPTLPAHVLIPTFYAQELGLGLAATGAAIFAARALDVLTDPLVGQASDRVGRRKPFIAVGAILAAIALVAVFAPPGGAGAIYLGLWYALLYVAWSLVMVPYTAWGAELTADYAERTSITSWREGFGLVGITVAASLPALLQQGGRSLSDAMTATALVAIALGAPALFLLLRFVPEGRRRPAARVIGWREAWTVIGRNAPFRRLLAAWFINGVANGLPAGLFPLFITLALGADDGQMGIVLLIYFAAALLSLPVWLRLQARVDKHRLWCGAMVAAILAFLAVPLLPVGAIPAFAVICVITGFALGADLALPPALQADVVDLDRLRQGGERAGLFFALSSMSAKLAAAIAVGIAFPVLDLFGLDLSAAQPGTGPAIIALAVIYAWVPCVFKTIAVLMMWRYPLDRTAHADIARALNI
ncbi:Na+/melibiose symporter-like transporter [Dongia mobilis]|uniref:Na+/melibiose symporter-like transporter n=1 Tax=Dongia mobilis TaxID=578943 RepID=A0A4R6WD12_9PROT|nr:MFS transporter [Dongia mobilis]TDQ77563.1 Na+/melibiose symporter-like transporter [Dongia mobilis]